GVRERRLARGPRGASGVRRHEGDPGVSRPRDEEADKDEALDPAKGDGSAPAEDVAENAGSGAVEAVGTPDEAKGGDPLAVLRKERDELRDQLLRRRADFENYRRRAERDRQQAGQEAVAAFLRELIPSLDNLERALESAGEEASLRE